jgi:hypothetical protein
VSDQLIVAGFHRSGTSLVCQLLHRAGLFLGYDLLEAAFSNPHGHFEDREVVDLHRQILADNGRTWLISEPFLPTITEAHWQRLKRVAERRDAEHNLWGFKDPRVCLFMMLWKHLLPNAKVLLVYRYILAGTPPIDRTVLEPDGSSTQVQALLGRAGSSFADVVDAQRGVTHVCQHLSRGHPGCISGHGSERVSGYQGHQPALESRSGRGAGI